MSVSLNGQMDVYGHEKIIFPKNRSVHISLYLEGKTFLVCLLKSWDGNMQI
ncbi:Hypothetical protein I595_1881 [Croceitalea dokdonensis DOKDO 023]|uniref:Uncharacterized protein n=1 Tax=Croceitalea dokdonensis DOKDO 023 TaxID=1300341 RepID=A0A0P7B029_9FLAO|nr:Hypothetical protein I595_1881 [Croceitalea dokdonensis DOKDO 023]